MIDTRKSRRQTVENLLPENIRKLPSLSYRYRCAKTREESLSDVEYDIKTAQDLSKAFKRRFGHRVVEH